MDKQTQKFLIQTVATINKESFKVFDMFGLDYFKEQHEKKVVKLKQDLSVLPIDIVKHIGSFLYFCENCKKDMRPYLIQKNQCHLCSNLFCGNGDKFEVFFSKDEDKTFLVVLMACLKTIMIVMTTDY